MFSYISLEERVPAAHPLRKLCAVVDALLATMHSEFEAVYARRGRPSVPPEMLLKALLLQILFSIRSERQLVEAVNYNLLYRWFVGLNIEDKVWDHSTFSAKDKHSAVDGRIKRHEGYKTSLKVRKRIEEAFGWIKTVGGLAKTKLIGQAKLAGQALLCFATYNLVRMGSIGGWWDAHHA